MSKKDYSKKPLNFDDQIKTLESRGMIFDIEKPNIQKYLSNYGYYRISAYYNLFRKYDTTKKKILDDFEDKTFFSEIIELYNFDSKLRNHILRGIEKIEISLRTVIAYILSTQTDDSFAQYDTKLFHPNFVKDEKYASWLKKVEHQIDRSSDMFIKHYKKTYTDFPKIPIWMFTEILTFGELSIFYQGLTNKLKQEIAKEFHPFHYKSLIPFFHRLSIIRNICAHHGRLWNRKIPIQGKLKQDGWNSVSKDKLFFTIVVMTNILNSRGILDNWYEILVKIISPKLNVEKYRYQMGFPNNWRTHPLLSSVK